MRKLTIAALIGLETLVSGCNVKIGRSTVYRSSYKQDSQTHKKKTKKEGEENLILKLREQQREFRAGINDKYHYLQYLKPFEYVVPDAVLLEMEKVEEPEKQLSSAGLYVSSQQNYNL